MSNKSCVHNLFNFIVRMTLFNSYLFYIHQPSKTGSPVLTRLASLPNAARTGLALQRSLTGARSLLVWLKHRCLHIPRQSMVLITKKSYCWVVQGSSVVTHSAIKHDNDYKQIELPSSAWVVVVTMRKQWRTCSVQNTQEREQYWIKTLQAPDLRAAKAPGLLLLWLSPLPPVTLD